MYFDSNRILFERHSKSYIIYFQQRFPLNYKYEINSEELSNKFDCGVVYKSMAGTSIENSKQFWHFIDTKIKWNCLPSCMRYLDKASSNSDEICNFFADHFRSMYSDFSIQSADYACLKQIFNISNINL